MNSQEILARIPTRNTGSAKKPHVYAIGISRHGAIHFHVEIEGELYITTLRINMPRSKVSSSETGK